MVLNQILLLTYLLILFIIMQCKNALAASHRTCIALRSLSFLFPSPVPSQGSKWHSPSACSSSSGDEVMTDDCSSGRYAASGCPRELEFCMAVVTGMFLGFPRKSHGNGNQNYTRGNSENIERLRTQFFTIFHKTLRTAQKCGRLDACCLVMPHFAESRFAESHFAEKPCHLLFFLKRKL